MNLWFDPAYSQSHDGPIIPRTPISERERAAIEEVEREAEAVSERRGRQGVAGSGTGVGGAGAAVLALGLVTAETVMRSASAIAEVQSGIQSSDPTQADVESVFKNIQSGDQGESDLDAAISVLEIGGYQVDAALTSWGTLQDASDIYGAYIQK